jgi:putative molybdopterin biosynthesis protein
MRQDQFLDVIDRDEAERRFQAVLDLRLLEQEKVQLEDALERVLAHDVRAPLDVPSFDRANVDGFALRAEDTFGAREEAPCLIKLTTEILACGMTPTQPVNRGYATALATGAMLPRGANAVVMIEHTDVQDHTLIVRRPVAPGANITFAGTDIGLGETVLRRGDLLTSRETGVLAALGIERVGVIRRPRVAIISTGDELISPGQIMKPGLVYDSNARIIADAVRELGATPVGFGIVSDDKNALTRALHDALPCDVILMSGGTSKGPGDLSCQVVESLGEPGIIVHGVALKPGKPLCLAAVKGQSSPRPVPIAILPGFPTSAIFTFYEFMAPIIMRLGGRRPDQSPVVKARLPMRVNSERGRTEYLLVGLVQDPNAKADAESAGEANVTAYPMGKGSGSVTTFSQADGFVIIPRQREYLEAGDQVDVHLVSKGLQTADLVVIGSHCIGLDYLLGRLREEGFRSKFLAVGSMGGLAAARRGECDIAGVHLLDSETNQYNTPFLGETLRLIPGYGRLQGLVFRKDDSRFASCTSAKEIVAQALQDPDCILINRNRGSGTRVLIDRLLGTAQPTGYLTEVRSHNAVAAAIAQKRADWGVAIEPVAREFDLGVVPLQEEQYDFVAPKSRWNRPTLERFRALLSEPSTHDAISRLGFRPTPISE